ncbi:GAF domain-containing sensor histidine kinase [Algoriphagus pacificus]|nr:GAF domain-containing sensor histidine kinase [Algoriphagus pacificus]
MKTEKLELRYLYCLLCCMSRPISGALQLLPENEMERLIALNNLDLDYNNLEESLSDLTKLAAKIAGTKISLVNLIDHYTQWSVAGIGMELGQTPREDTVCQYLVYDSSLKDLEIENMEKDSRFFDKTYVKEEPNLRYYYGIPLKLNEEINIGALCVLDTDYKQISPEKKEMLSIIAKEVVNKLKIYKAIEGLQHKIHETKKVKDKVAHDIRGPLGGIIGLAEIIQLQGNKNKLEEVLEFISLIQKSGKSLLELADEILALDYEGKIEGHTKQEEFTLNTVKSKIQSMYAPQALTKSIQFDVEVNFPNAEIPIPKNKVLQILGNLISNSIKFTPIGGNILVKLDLEVIGSEKLMIFEVEDSGEGIEEEKIQNILNGEVASTSGSMGEKGYGFGLNLVLHLVNSLHGKLAITSKVGRGTIFKVKIPVN